MTTEWDMDFGEALAVLKRGRKVRRAVWPSTTFIERRGSLLYYHYSSGGETQWYAHCEDILAEDWVAAK